MSVKLYHVTQTNLAHDGYRIKVNGTEARLDTARVSAMPFNRRWPGHQRSTEQTELINFLSMETDEEVSFEIIPKEKFAKVEIRPKSLGIEPEITSDGRILFTLKKAAYFTVEPYGRHNALHIFADPVSDYKIDTADSNVIYYGKGEHHAGMIELKSNQTLFIDEGAVVYACVRANDAENIRICGRGILDNSENTEEILYEANAENNFAQVDNAIRLHTIQPEYCSNISIEGITIRDSLVYNIRPKACENLNIENVKIVGCWRYNSDGIDMHNCRNVLINNCFLRTYDDSICVKGFDCYYNDDVEKSVTAEMYRGGKSYDVFENVLVKNCTIWNDWGKCLEIGAETRAEEIRDITFENCSIIHVTNAVLDCQNVDYGYVHDVLYKDITIEYDDMIPEPQIQVTDLSKYQETPYVPIVISVSVDYHPEYSAGGKRRGKNQKITFQNINILGKQKLKMAFRGFDAEHKTSDILIKNLHMNGRPATEDDIEYSENEFVENVTII